MTNTNDALAEYANPLNWDADANGVRRIWREPGSDTPDAYNGFEMARAALTTAAVVPPSSAALERLREWEAKGELLERAWDTMVAQEREIIRLESLLAAAPKAEPEPAVWVAADTLNAPHPTCISSPAYMSQLDRERGREYVPLYATPVAAQAAPAAVAGPLSEHYDEVRATLTGLHALCENVSAQERRIGPLGSHARGYTWKITAALRHLDALAAAPTTQAAPPPAVQQGDAEDAERWREIRSITGSNIRVVDIETNTSLFLECADAAIDAARSQAKEGQGHE